MLQPPRPLIPALFAYSVYLHLAQALNKAAVTAYKIKVCTLIIRYRLIHKTDASIYQLEWPGMLQTTAEKYMHKKRAAERLCPISLPNRQYFQCEHIATDADSTL